MKKLVVVILALFLIAPIAMAKDATIKVGWDQNTEPDMVQGKYLIFHRVEGQGYNYTVPVKVVPFPIIEADVPLMGIPDNAVTKNYLVVRAEDATQNQSGDSREVWISFDSRVPPVPVITAGVYNEVADTVDLTWDQTNSELVTKWKLFMATVSGGPYAEIAEMVNSTPDNTISWAIPGDGTYYFTIVGFRDGSETKNVEETELTIIDSAFTTDSNQMMVEVKKHPAPTKNFKVKIRVQ